MVEHLCEKAMEIGFDQAVALNVSALRATEMVRSMCAADKCHAYGKNWTCPPHCGTVEECQRKMNSFSRGILVQTYGDIEDGFDFEAMMEIEADHKAHFTEMYDALRASEESVLALGAGCCTACAKCTYPESPCRFPEKMVSSMEAYGMVVLEVCKANGLTYYYGADKMAYTSCFLL